MEKEQGHSTCVNCHMYTGEHRTDYLSKDSASMNRKFRTRQIGLVGHMPGLQYRLRFDP
jgi:hypothetical protein